MEAQQMVVEVIKSANYKKTIGLDIFGRSSILKKQFKGEE
jgi:hypothetical protein